MLLLSEGLYLDGKGVIGPFGFYGIFAMSLVLISDTATDDCLYLFELILSDGGILLVPEHAAII